MSGSQNKRGERKGSRTSLSKKAIRATKAVRIPQEGCQVSLRVRGLTTQHIGSSSVELAVDKLSMTNTTHGWKLEMERQIFLFISNRPDGVSM